MQIYFKVICVILQHNYRWQWPNLLCNYTRSLWKAVIFAKGKREGLNSPHCTTQYSFSNFRRPLSSFSHPFPLKKKKSRKAFLWYQPHCAAARFPVRSFSELSECYIALHSFTLSLSFSLSLFLSSFPHGCLVWSDSSRLQWRGTVWLYAGWPILRARARYPCLPSCECSPPPQTGSRVAKGLVIGNPYMSVG